MPRCFFRSFVWAAVYVLVTTNLLSSDNGRPKCYINELFMSIYGLGHAV